VLPESAAVAARDWRAATTLLCSEKRMSKSRVRIPVRSGVHVGSEKAPYHVADSPAKRRRAVRAGVRDRMAEGMSRAEALADVKARLNALRILNHKRTDACDAMTADMRAIDSLRGRGHTSPDICRRKRTSAGRRTRRSLKRRVSSRSRSRKR
jgi:hypothetical protein